jgi:HKD family nuclease
MLNLRTLLGDGCSVVVGLPTGFDLSMMLRSATEVRLATAFAHKSGWNHLKPGIEGSAANVFLLTGTEFNQTEPALLKEWHQLKLSHSDRVNVSLASDSTFFHPKVLIVRTAQKAFAVVGSGNLSLGGLQHNCECSVYIEDGSTVTELCDWFDIQFAAGTPLVAQMISIYEVAYEKTKAARSGLEKAQKITERKLKEVGDASMLAWDRALDLAEAYFRNADFDKRYASHVAASKQLLKHLDAPRFDFDRIGWQAFYEVGELGRLDMRYRDKVFKSANRLKQALSELVSSPSGTIPKLLSHRGQFRIKGFGVNTLSKILASYYPREWPVYNSRVARALTDFGYKAPKGVGPDGRYIAFRNSMKKFMSACESRGLRHVDAISLDAFFYDRSKELGY